MLSQPNMSVFSQCFGITSACNFSFFPSIRKTFLNSDFPPLPQIKTVQTSYTILPSGRYMGSLEDVDLLESSTSYCSHPPSSAISSTSVGIIFCLHLFFLEGGGIVEVQGLH